MRLRAKRAGKICEFSCKMSSDNRLGRVDRGGILSPWIQQFITPSFYSKRPTKIIENDVCRPQNAAPAGVPPGAARPPRTPLATPLKLVRTA